MALYSGTDGSLLIDGKVAAKVQSWSFQSSQTMLDAPSLGDTDRVVVPSIRSLTGACRLFYYQSGAGAGGDVTTLLNKCMKAGGSAGDSTNALSSPAVLRLRVNDGTANGRYIELSAYISSLSMAMSVGEVVSADIQFEADGAPTGIVM